MVRHVAPKRRYRMHYCSVLSLVLVVVQLYLQAPHEPTSAVRKQ